MNGGRERGWINIGGNVTRKEGRNQKEGIKEVNGVGDDGNCAERKWLKRRGWKCRCKMREWRKEGGKINDVEREKRGTGGE